MQVGDQFIRYTNKGAIKGRVKSIQVKYKYDLVNKVKFEVLIIKSESGETYDSAGCYLVREEITWLDALRLRKLFAKAKSILGK